MRPQRGLKLAVCRQEAISQSEDPISARPLADANDPSPLFQLVPTEDDSRQVGLVADYRQHLVRQVRHFFGCGAMALWPAVRLDQGDLLDQR